MGTEATGPWSIFATKFTQKNNAGEYEVYREADLNPIKPVRVYIRLSEASAEAKT